MVQPTQTENKPAANKFAALKKPIPPELVRQREGWRDGDGNSHLVEYVEWHTVVDILDREAPDWAHAVRDVREIGEMTIVTVAVTIDGITREGIGCGAAASETGIKKAEHDALKRAAVKFGVARELYKKESDLIERQGATRIYDSARVANPVARSEADLCSAKQLGMIRSLAREKGVDAQTVCEEIWSGINLNELSKKAASDLIAELQSREATATAEPTEVRTGIPSTAAVPERDNLRELNPKTTAAAPPPATENADGKDEIENLRNEIVEKFNEVRQPADSSLASFDYERTAAKKKDVYRGIMNYVVQIKREQLSAALAAAGWEPNEIDGELAKFGIADGGLRKASPEQINRMWANYRKDKQL